MLLGRPFLMSRKSKVRPHTIANGLARSVLPRVSAPVPWQFREDYTPRNSPAYRP